MLRHGMHAFLCIAAFVPWLVGVLAFGSALLLTLAADRLWPDATWGNCWTFVGPRWFRHGGYVQVRMAPAPRLFGLRIIPHAIWLKSAHPDSDVEQTAPITRVTRVRDAWQTLYFRFRVHRQEPYTTRPIDL